MSTRRSSKPSVQWYVPNRKRPIAYSSTATKNWIDMLTDCGLTINQMHRASIIDSEAQIVLEAYIERGYGSSTGLELNFEGASVDEKTEIAIRRMVAENEIKNIL